MSSFSPILDVVIGICGVYVAFSLMASWCNERVAAAFNLRSVGLVNGIYQLLNGNTEAFTKFVNDPMFQAMQHAASNSIPPPPPPPPKTPPGSIPPPPKVVTPAPADPKMVAANAPSYMSSQQFSAIFMNLVAPQSASDAIVKPGTADEAVAQAKAFITGVQSAANNLGVGPQVNALLVKSGGDYDKFVAGIESWYDDHMDRVSGWYKRQSHKILFTIGLALAIILNVDSVRLYQGLTCNSALRGAAATAATANATPGSAVNVDIVKGMLQAVPVGWARWPWVGRPDEAIGCAGANTAEPWPNDWYFYLFFKLLGLLLTAVAISLGAPFWFDALSCITNVRAAGAKPNSDANKKGT